MLLESVVLPEGAASATGVGGPPALSVAASVIDTGALNQPLPQDEALQLIVLVGGVVSGGGWLLLTLNEMLLESVVLPEETASAKSVCGPSATVLESQLMV